VGTRCLIVLLESGTGSPLFLQFKEATASVLEPHAAPSEFDHAGERVVRGQRLMQATGDAATISGYLGDDSTIDHILVEFAERYADLAEDDHAAHLAAIAARRVVAADG